MSAWPSVPSSPPSSMGALHPGDSLLQGHLMCAPELMASNSTPASQLARLNYVQGLLPEWEAAVTRTIPDASFLDLTSTSGRKGITRKDTKKICVKEYLTPRVMLTISGHHPGLFWVRPFPGRKYPDLYIEAHGPWDKGKERWNLMVHLTALDQIRPLATSASDFLPYCLSP